MSDIVASVDAPQHGGAGESKSEQVHRRLSGKHKPRVAIVGGGFASIAAAKSLRGCDADVTLIDRRNHHIQLPYAPRDLYRNVIREVNAGCSKTSVTRQRLGLSRI